MLVQLLFAARSLRQLSVQQFVRIFLLFNLSFHLVRFLCLRIELRLQLFDFLLKLLFVLVALCCFVVLLFFELLKAFNFLLLVFQLLLNAPQFNLNVGWPCRATFALAGVLESGDALLREIVDLPL